MRTQDFRASGLPAEELIGLLKNLPSIGDVGRPGIRSVMKQAGCSDEQILDYLEVTASQQDADRGNPKSKPTQSTIIANLASDAELFHTPNGKAFAAVNIRGKREVFPVRSADFRGHLYSLFYDKVGGTASSQAVQDALSNLEARAKLYGEEHPVFCRVAQRDQFVYLDLANAARDVVVISAQGWSIHTDVSVRFRRMKAMLALPRPVPGGSLVRELRPFINACENDFTLIIAWLLSTIQPFGAYPILQIKGEQGSSKSTTSKLLRNLVDMNESPARSHPRDERDLVIALSNSHVGCFDNLSSMPEWLSDSLCRASTGNSFSTRTLFTDEEETILSVKRPVIINGIEELSTRGDLVDRSILIDLPRISAERRRTEQDYWGAFNEAHPRILGALLDTASAALGRLSEVTIPELPRMSDFARFVTAAEQHLGWEDGTFMKAYRRNRADAESGVLEASPIASGIQRLFDEKRSWKLTAEDLLKLLSEKASPIELKHPGWPKTPHKLGNEINRVTPNLRTIGIDVNRFKSGKRYLILTKG